RLKLRKMGVSVKCLKDVERQIDEAIEWLEDNPNAEIDEMENKEQELNDICRLNKSRVYTLGSLFTNSSESASTSTESDECSAVETIVRGARSDRLFFEPDATSSILETHASGRKCTTLVYKESITLVMESNNPYQDFKKSMEEMVEMHGLKDWECLEELLRWYLRMNAKNNHEFIVWMLLGFACWK
ncbi:transcription repressor OFP13-like protein, partial [Tanacetum coccineum]